METDRLDDAQRVFETFLAEHGEDGVVLTNLAKIYYRRGDHARAESILWHALEVDPNQDNGLNWYVAIQRERGGEAAALAALRRIAGLPRSWRARLWLAREALERKDPAAAETLYTEALALAGSPVPVDLVMQMSGDLGNHGYLTELIRLTAPHFDPAVHGLGVGNNLIKAYFDLGCLEDAERILNRLFAQKRPDWRQTLDYWDTELAKARVALQGQAPPDQQISMALFSIEGPLWMRDGSPFVVLLAEKPPAALRIAFFGTTALLAEKPARPGVQLSDASGRLTRAVPLLLAEPIHLATAASGYTLIPWVQGRGFALFGVPYEDSALCELAGKAGDNAPDFIVGVTLEATKPLWQILLRLIRPADGRRLAEASIEIDPENPGLAVNPLVETTVNMLAAHTGLRPSRVPAWYQRPAGADAADYLLRLEQQLALACAYYDEPPGTGLSREREMLDGALQLCLRHPANPTVRMVLAQMLRCMKKVRPGILAEYKYKVNLLQREYPLAGEIGSLVQAAITESFADGQ